MSPVSVFKSFKNHTRLSRIHSNGRSETRIRPRLVRLYVRFTRMANRISRVFCLRPALSSDFMYIYLYAFPVQPKKTEESCADPDPGGGGVVTRIPDPHPLENHKVKGFLRNTAPEPMENHSYSASIQCWVTFGPPAKCHSMAFRWWADGGPLCLLDRVSFSYTGTDPSLSLCKRS